MDTIITNASSTLQTALGFGFSDLVAYLKTQLTFVIGIGLGLFEQLLPYIVGLIVIGAIVYFVYRAFRFFRH